ncbi:MAG: DNA alkylation repair protein [Flavobacteriales bacterium]
MEMKIPHHIIERKPARKMSEIPKEVLVYLNSGKIETKNLVEWLAVNQFKILDVLLEELDSKKLIKKFKANNTENSHNKLARLIGSQFLTEFGPEFKLSAEFKHMCNHSSDIVREWTCYSIGLHPKDSLETKLTHIYPLANDPNPGLREVAWFALREHVSREIDNAINLLSAWTCDDKENIRRYASEITRPRGVWCSHIQILKENPERAIKILNQLKSDPSRYVQNSIANWLNDASKTRPDWVWAINDKWKKNSSKETEYILKRGLRTLKK